MYCLNPHRTNDTSDYAPRQAVFHGSICYENTPISQIQQGIKRISHNAPFCGRDVIQNGALWVIGWCIVGNVQQIYCYVWCFV